MRGADGGRWSRICGLPALWVGLLYDDQALDAAWDLVKHWSIDAARETAPRGAEARARRGHSGWRDDAGLRRPRARHRADGLTRRARLNSAGDNEGGFLDPLRDVVATGMTPADRLLVQVQR